MSAGGTRYGPRRDLKRGSVSGVRVLALVGLIVGLLMLPLLDTPRESLALGDDDLDESSSPWVILTAEVPSLTPALVIRGVNDVKHTSLWHFRYLTRPQLLTR